MVIFFVDTLLRLRINEKCGKPGISRCSEVISPEARLNLVVQDLQENECRNLHFVGHRADSFAC